MWRHWTCHAKEMALPGDMARLDYGVAIIFLAHGEFAGNVRLGGTTAAVSIVVTIVVIIVATIVNCRPLLDATIR
jgi:hypothetical protein